MGQKEIGKISVNDLKRGFKVTESYHTDKLANSPDGSSMKEWQDMLIEDTFAKDKRLSPKECLALREGLQGAEYRELERANHIPLKEALDVTGYPILLSSGVKANLYEGYKLPVTVFEQLVTVEKSTKREEKYGGLYETDLPAEVKPGDNYQESDLGEKSAYIESHKYGRILALDMEVVWHDQQNQILRKAKDLGRGARLHQEQTVINYVIDANDNNYRTTSSKTGSALYSSGNRNLLTTALSASQLETAIQYMRNQRDDRGNPMLVIPDTILGPLELEGDMHRILKAQGRTGVANQNQDEYNYLREQFGGAWKILCSPFFSVDDANDWYLMSRQMGALIYQEVLPVTVLEETTESGHMFDRDVKRFKVVNYFGVGAIDHRPFQANRVA